MDESANYFTRGDKIFFMRNGKDYEIVDGRVYMLYLQSNGAKPLTAVKTGGVIAHKGTPGEEIIAYTNNGNVEVVEVCTDGNWILTKADNAGNPVIDNYGHTNTWQVSQAVLRDRYDFEHMSSNGFVKPKAKPQTFLEVDADIAILKPWGKDGELIPQTLDKGGYINITNPSNVYCIARDEFYETYTQEVTNV